MTVWSPLWVVPSRCVGEFTAGPFTFITINAEDLAADLLGLFSRCGVLPMIHVPGIARFVIDRKPNARLIVRLDNVNEAVVKVGNLGLIRYVFHLASRLNCKGGGCIFRGDVSMLDIEGFRLRLPISSKFPTAQFTFNGGYHDP